MHSLSNILNAEAARHWDSDRKYSHHEEKTKRLVLLDVPSKTGSSLEEYMIYIPIFILHPHQVAGDTHSVLAA